MKSHVSSTVSVAQPEADQDYDLSSMTGANDDEVPVTGPAPLDASDPDRPNARPISFLRGVDPDDQTRKPFNRRISRAISVISLSKRGQRLLNSLENNDIQLGGLGPGQAIGYYLAYDRALFTQTRDLAETIQNIAHEARHAEQTIAGWSTVTEYHQPGTKLPHDTRSYLRLNRVLEADADATALAVLWEVSKADSQYQHVWSNLYNDPHYGPMAMSFEQAVLSSGFDATDDRSVRAGMKAAFRTWPTVGSPLRSEGYDDYMMAWLESQASKKSEPVQADRAFGIDEAATITGLNEAGPYWSAKDDPVTAALMDRFISRFEPRLEAMDKQLLPPKAPEQNVVIDASDVSRWRDGRKPAAPQPSTPTGPGF